MTTTIDPFASVLRSFETFEKMATESTIRSRAWLDELEKFRKDGLDRMTTTFEGLAVLQKDTLAYAMDLGRAWMALAQDAMRQATATRPAAPEARA